MNLILGIKVVQYNSIVDCVKIIKKYCAKANSAIIDNIKNNEYVLCYDCADRIGLKAIISCYNDFCNASITSELYELDNRKTCIENLLSRDSLYDEISEEIDNQ